MKLVVFSNPSKLNDLMQNHDDEINEEFIGEYANYSEGSEYSEEVVYISGNGDFEIGNYNSQKVKAASIIILRDNYPNDSLVNDLDEFCILRHTETPALYGKLIVKCNGRKIEQQEEQKYEGEESLYFQLVKFIGNEKPFNYTSFFKQYVKPMLDKADDSSILDQKLEFLHKCLISPPENLGKLSKFQNYSEIEISFSNLKFEFEKSNNNPVNLDYLKALAEFRDVLLKTI
ncbi:hypothetical protein LJB85_02415 [Porphyromonadaceae bacterium OttesenSCG-928-L07]|nr:hypothetical protein [Porphyromonadaceae bacterium OttesenSCG-928-L07]